MSDAHCYERRLGTIGPEDSLTKLATWIAQGSTVLELGPACGYFSAYLRDALGCTVDAVEMDPAMAERARPFCRQLLVADLAGFDPVSRLPQGGYDAIVAADVVEHLAAPEPLLRRLAPLLRPGGQLLLSVPNVAYAGLAAALMDGRFDYRDEGLLDRTHLRFFTRESLAALLATTGWNVAEWAAVFRPLLESEFKLRLDRSPAALVQALLARPHALCYQWLARAVTVPRDEPALPPPCCQDAYPCRLYLRNRDEPDDSDRELTAWAGIGGAPETLSFPLPQLSASHLRLNLADRAGELHLSGVRIVRDQEIHWRWMPDQGVGALASLHDGLSLAEGAGYAEVALARKDSWLLLAPVGLSVPQGSRLEVDVCWPMAPEPGRSGFAWEG